MNDILGNNYQPDSQTLATMPTYTTETNETTESSGKLGNFLDSFFRYGERAVGLYKTATSDQPVGTQPGYDIDLGKPQDKRVLGMPQVTGYIVIATVIGLLGYAIYSVKTRKAPAKVKSK